jgi:hypothetical protein
MGKAYGSLNPVLISTDQVATASLRELNLT